jgi:hypothetical protein
LVPPRSIPPYLAIAAPPFPVGGWSHTDPVACAT